MVAERTGCSGALLTGYGSYGITLDPSFVPEMLAWYERGGVYAVAHLRGGGEHGSQWHEAGRKLRKETTITDFIDCAEYLVARGWTRPDRLAGSTQRQRDEELADELALLLQQFGL